MLTPFLKYLFALGWLLAGAPGTLLAQVTLTDQTNQYTIGRQVAILADTNHVFRTLPDVLRDSVSRAFEPSQQQSPNRGFSTADYWVRFDLTNQSRANRSWLLEIGFGNFSMIDLYLVSKRTGKVIHKRGGELLGRQAREISYYTYLFYLPISPGDPQTVYIRLVSTFGQATFPLFILREDAFVHSAQLSGLLWGLYYGFLVSVFLYHLFLLLLNREKNYLLLTLYLAAYIFYEITRGYCVGVRFLWPGHVWLLTHGLATAFTLTITSFMVFYSSVLDLKLVAPRLQTGIYGLIGMSIMGWLLTLFSLPGISQNLIITAGGVISGSYVIFLGSYCWYLGYRPARYYWAAAVAIFLGGLVHSMNRAGIIPGSNFFVHYTLNLGSVLEFVFLSIGVADTVRTERRQRTQLRQQLTTEVDAAELRGLADERERVAAEIHDGVGNSLLNLRESIRSMQTGDKATPALNKLEQLVQDTYDEVRKIANDMLPAEFEQKGLEVALRELVTTLNYSNQTQFYLLMSGHESQLKPATQFQLYLVIVELINNILKHANATEASIRFTKTGDLLQVTIRDNGIGLISTPTTVSRRGWTNVRKRLSRVGGHFQLVDKTEKGVSIAISVPVSPASHT
ncbi:sensor histidine kinase [Fibrella arboris]|uniref:sensor histidine kinase n=1 Tax=Fibrella arboris TaxID=3242486 RepID=UPI003520C880